MSCAQDVASCGTLEDGAYIPNNVVLQLNSTCDYGDSEALFFARSLEGAEGLQLRHMASGLCLASELQLPDLLMVGGWCWYCPLVMKRRKCLASRLGTCPIDAEPISWPLLPLAYLVLAYPSH